MKTRVAFAAFLIFAAAFVSAAPNLVVLRGGKTLDLSKPYVQRGSQAILTLKDGTVMSVPVSEIDRAATQAARAKAASGPASAAPPQTPVEAAKAQQTAAKAKVKLGDADVSHPLGDDLSGSASSESAAGEAKVDVAEWEQSVTPEGLLVKGSVRNSGKGQAENLSLSISAKNESGKALATGSATLAAGALEEGASATFTATLPLKARASSLQFRPSWSTAAPTIKRDSAGNPKSETEKQEKRSAAPPPPPPAPPPTEEKPAYKPNPDYAPPAANAPTSAPDDNHVGYIPGVHEETPPPPPPPPPPPSR